MDKHNPSFLIIAPQEVIVSADETKPAKHKNGSLQTFWNLAKQEKKIYILEMINYVSVRSVAR